MYQFERLVLNNYLTWEEVAFDFEPGITQISGRNRSGKSLLVTPIRAALYDTLNVPQNSRATFSFSNEQHNYDFSVFNKGKTKNSFAIAIDEKDQAVETRDAALRLIHDHFSFHVQESLFETTVSISGLNKHPLADGKPSQRLDWVHETLAYASLLDEHIEDVERLIKPARENGIKHKMLQEQIASIDVPDMPNVNVEKLEDNMEAVREVIQRVETRLRAAERVLEYLDSAVEKPKYAYAEVVPLVDKLRKALEGWEYAARVCDAYEKQLPQFDKLQKLVTKCKENYTEACHKLGRPVVKPSVAVIEIAEEIDELEESIARNTKNNKLYDEQTELRLLSKTKIKLKDRLLDVDDIPALKKKRGALQEDYSIAKRTLQAVKSGEEVCSVCGSDITAVSHDPNTLRDDIVDLEERIARTDAQLEVLEARQIKFVKQTDTIVDTLLIEKLQGIHDAAKAYLSAKQRLDDLGELKEPDVDYDAAKHAATKAKLQQMEQHLIDAKAYNQSTRPELLDSNSFADLPKSELLDIVADCEEKKQRLYKKSAQLSDAIVEARTAIALNAQGAKQKSSLITQAAEFTSAASDFKILTILRKALGRDGFRTKRLEKTLELFVANLNELAPVIFDEPFKFEIETGPRKCDVIIHRNKKRGDAFTLSGMEQRSWQALAGLAMLRILPANRRCDTIILDEVEANMDPISRHRLMRDFIPEIAKTVPNVIVVSPLPSRELGLQPDRGYFVEKRNARSHLKTL